ncbi:MAG: hypothetical protein ACRDSZ_05680 [Pseudonocardiaceae bacterium]
MGVGFSAASAGVAFDDEFVGGGNEPVDGGLGEEWGQSSWSATRLGARFEVSTVAAGPDRLHQLADHLVSQLHEATLANHAGRL